MTNDMLLPFAFPAMHGKKVTAAFDGGRITSNGGVMVLAATERKLDIAAKLATVICGRRDPQRVVHRLPDILRARIFAIACGYEDADDLDWRPPSARGSGSAAWFRSAMTPRTG
jgi:hypothetical protein